MGLSNKKEERLRNMPIISSRVKASKNGKYIIQQTVITSLKPIEYYRAILANTVKVTHEPLKEEELMIEDGEDMAKRL